MARRRYADFDRAHLIRAATLARLPGVRRAEACERFGLSLGMLRRAMSDFALEAIPSRRHLVLHALTDAGTKHSGELPDLARVASYLDYTNKDGSTAADIRAILDDLEREGVVAFDGPRWRLLTEFP